MNGEVFISISLFAAIALSIYFFLRARTTERLALIEKGLDVSHLHKKRNHSYWLLQTGLVLIGISLGLLIGSFLEKNTSMPEPIPYFSMVLLFGGISMIIGNLISSRKKKKDESMG